MAAQSDDTDLAESFGPVAQALTKQEEKIVAELNGAQGVAMDIDGYYFPSQELAAKAMRPSGTLNTILSTLL